MKNMDPLNDNVVSLLSNSPDWFVGVLWKDTANIVSIHAKDDSAASKFGGNKPRKGMFRTVGQLYKVCVWGGVCVCVCACCVHVVCVCVCVLFRTVGQLYKVCVCGVYVCLCVCVCVRVHVCMLVSVVDILCAWVG